MASSPVQAKSVRERILIVEDDGVIARDIRRMLEELGYAIAGIAASGAEAMALAERGPVDLVLMEVNIKGEIDGIKAAAQLVQRFGLPVVYLSAYTDDDTLARARDTEPFGYMAKPVTLADVKVAVAVALTRFRSQRLVEQRQEWFHSILQNTVEAMVILTPDGRISFLNRAAEEITGNTLDQAEGRAFDDVIQLLTDDGNVQSLLGSQINRSIHRVKTAAGTIVRSDQTQRHVVVTIAPLQQGRNLGNIVVLHDISELWTREQELMTQNEQFAHANEKLTYFSYSLSQDLREPLNNIHRYSELLRLEDQGGLGEEAKMQLQGISAASQRMESVMSALVDYFAASKFNRAEARWIDANEPFQEALLNLSVAIDLSRAWIEAPDLPKVYAHPTALMLIFQNLIGNAIKYSDRQAPLIRVFARLEEDHWLFTVEDNGQGFDPQHAERIFELFKRAHGNDRPGCGIGLATCQRLVEQHAGVIWAESKPGEGARFHFTLPLAGPSPSLEE